WSRLGWRAPLRSRSLGRSYRRVRSRFLAPQQHGVRGDAEAAHGVRGGAAESRLPEAAALRPSARPHSGPQAPDAEPPPPPFQTQTPPQSLQQPAPPGSERRLPTPEQIFQNIKQEYSRYQRWRHLEVVLNQSEACASESQPHSSALTAPSSPGSSWMKKDQPTFTLRQVGIICERLLKDYEDKIREEYEQILNTKLAEQYESFVKFTHDQIMRRYGTRPTSYVS
uniref:Akirin 1 n=1 Tax=Macaca fascicularis TaxID=9541 RepID=A0A2K5WLW6_MACFA